jgi:A/G-specific adenine glycosylase
MTKISKKIEYNGCMQLDKKKIDAFRKEILDWYRLHQRKLPWREVPFDTSLQCRDPYRILVSEVMLQQTQVSRVIPKYIAWLEKFPTVQDLASAKVSDVLQLWSGLGYNRRALNLKKTAEAVVRDYGGSFPKDETSLLRLPGIGKYTARALMCFAFDEQVAVVDTNVKKVILTKFVNELGIKNSELSIKNNKIWGIKKQESSLRQAQTLSISKGSKEDQNDDSFLIHDSRRKESITEKEIWQIAEALVPYGRAYEWNQGLMDYAGAMLKQEKIPIPKQSKFVGSHRYYRGRVIKALLEKKTIGTAALGALIKNDFSTTDQAWLDGLLQELQQEGFLQINKGEVSLH